MSALDWLAVSAAVGAVLSTLLVWRIGCALALNDAPPPARPEAVPDADAA